MKGGLRDEKGAAVAMAALAMTVLIGFTALVVDVGAIYLERTRLSNVMDAAALAGAQELPIAPAQAVATALEYVERNGIDPAGVDVQLSDDLKSISVIAEANLALRFAPVIGVEEAKVGAKATAQAYPVTAGDGIAPLCVADQEFAYGELYKLKDGAGPDDPELQGTEGLFRKGWFGALALGGNGAYRYRNNLQYGYSGKIEVGDILDVKTGNVSGPTQQAIQWRLNQEANSNETWMTASRDNKRILLVPVIEPYSYQGQHVDKVKVLGFAAFWLESIPGNGNDSEVYGRFLKMISNGTSSEGAGDYGLYGVRLTQ